MAASSVRRHNTARHYIVTLRAPGEIFERIEAVRYRRGQFSGLDPARHIVAEIWPPPSGVDLFASAVQPRIPRVSHRAARETEQHHPSFLSFCNALRATGVTRDEENPADAPESASHDVGSGDPGPRVG